MSTASFVTGDQSSELRSDSATLVSGVGDRSDGRSRYTKLGFVDARIRNSTVSQCIKYHDVDWHPQNDLRWIQRERSL